MPTALTAEERSICRLCGITEAAFLAAKHADTHQNPPALVSALTGRPAALSAEERKIIHLCGLTEAAFQTTKHAT